MVVPEQHQEGDIATEPRGGNANMRRGNTPETIRTGGVNATNEVARSESATSGGGAQNDELDGGNANLQHADQPQILMDVALENAPARAIGDAQAQVIATYAAALAQQDTMARRLERPLISRWKRVPRVNVDGDVTQALLRTQLSLNKQWVTRITFNFRQLRRLEKSLRNGNLTDLQTVREVLSIQHEELTWGIQNPNIATLRRKRVEVGAWVKSARTDMDLLDHGEEWRKKVNALYDTHKVDVYVYRAKIADTRGPCIRWRVRHDAKEEQQQQDPNIGESWFRNSFAVLEAKGAKFPTIELDDSSRLWACAVDGNPDGDNVRDDSMANIEFAGDEKEKLFTARLGPVDIDVVDDALMFAEHLCQQLGCEVGKGGWKTDTHRDSLAYVFAIVSGVSGPGEFKCAFETMDRTIESVLTISEGDNKPTFVRTEPRLYSKVATSTTTVAATRSASNQGAAAEQRGAATTGPQTASGPATSQQIGNSASSGSDAPAAAAASETSVQTPAQPVPKVSREKTKKEYADEGFCCAIAFAKELNRANNTALTKEDVQQAIKGTTEKATWSAKDVLAVAGKYGVVVWVQMGHKRYMVGQRDAYVKKLYVNITNAHMTACDDASRQKITDAVSTRAGTSQLFGQLKLALRGRKTKSSQERTAPSTRPSPSPSPSRPRAQPMRATLPNVAAAAAVGDADGASASGASVDVAAQLGSPTRGRSRVPSQQSPATNASGLQARVLFARGARAATAISPKATVEDKNIPPTVTSPRTFAARVADALPPLATHLAAASANDNMAQVAHVEVDESPNPPQNDIPAVDFEARIVQLLAMQPADVDDSLWITKLRGETDTALDQTHLSALNQRADQLRDWPEGRWMSWSDRTRWRQPFTAGRVRPTWKEQMSLLAIEAAEAAFAGRLDTSKQKLALLAYAGGWSYKPKPKARTRSSSEKGQGLTRGKLGRFVRSTS